MKNEENIKEGPINLFLKPKLREVSTKKGVKFTSSPDSRDELKNDVVMTKKKRR